MPPYTPKPGYDFPGPPPVEAMAYFDAKRLQVGFDHRDIWPEEHATSFTVAKAMELDILSSIRRSLSQALTEGITYRQWAKDLTPELQRLGWWGRQTVTDPLTGERVDAQLGSPQRLRTIYNANLASARSAGQWARIERTRASHPYLLYLLGPSQEHRLQHVGWRGTLLTSDDPWWVSHMPPNGWGCKCYVRQMSAAKAQQLRTGGLTVTGEPILDSAGNPTGHSTRIKQAVKTTAPATTTREWRNQRTGQVEQVPTGIDRGWDTNPGLIARREHAARLLADKLPTAHVQDGATQWQTVQPLIADALADDYRHWLDSQPPKDAQRVVGGLTPALLDTLITRGLTPSSAAISIQADTAKRLPDITRLPELLAQPDAILWDRQQPALLYVRKALTADGNARHVLRIVTDTAGRTHIQQGGISTRAELQDPAKYAIISGSL